VESFDLDLDTIAALSSPLGRGGIAVIRISGPKTLSILRRIIERWASNLNEKVNEKEKEKITPNRLYHSFVTKDGIRIDECMTVFFKAPHSYTGEDCAEISIHSNPFLVEEVLNLVCSIDTQGIRPALPGEFTYRAFENGKMDLLQAEAVNELINANSRYFAHMTFGSLQGKLSQFIMELKNELVDLAVQIETLIEFQEDQCLDEISNSISNRLDKPLQRLDALLSNSRFNDLLDKGISIVIVGKVNVGKSSLFNFLLMEERSIISSIPGTTRDFIREKIFIDGFPIELTDIAGINPDSHDDIEAQGIRRSFDRIRNADAVIFLIDGSCAFDSTDIDIFRLIENKPKLVAVNKSDVGDLSVSETVTGFFKKENETAVFISVKEHINIDAVTRFLKAIVNRVKDRESEFSINRRQKQALEELKVILDRTAEMIRGHSVHTEIIAEEIRSAVHIIGRLTGEITPDDILEKIFSEFCIGK